MVLKKVIQYLRSQLNKIPSICELVLEYMERRILVTHGVPLMEQLMKLVSPILHIALNGFLLSITISMILIVSLILEPRKLLHLEMIQHHQRSQM